MKFLGILEPNFKKLDDQKIRKVTINYRVEVRIKEDSECLLKTNIVKYYQMIKIFYSWSLLP